MFGGVAAQLNHLSIVLQIATADDIGIALTYDQLLKAHLEELARALATGAAGAADFHDIFERTDTLQAASYSEAFRAYAESWPSHQKGEGAAH